MEVEDTLTIGLGVGTLAGLAVLLWWVLGQLAPVPSTQTYWIEFERPIHGLSSNAAVTMRGVDIGYVGKIEAINDPRRGFISRVRVVVTRAGVPLWSDGPAVVRSIDNPALARRAGLDDGDVLVALIPVSVDGKVGEPQLLTDAEGARAALSSVQGPYLLRVRRHHQVRELAFAAGARPQLELTDEPGPAVVIEAGPLANRHQGLRPRDRLTHIGGEAVDRVADAQAVLLRLATRADDLSTTALVVAREGVEAPIIVPLSGRDGPPLITFWGMGTRATLESNLVTGIKKVELTGAPPMGPDGTVAAQEIAVDATIPADESDLWSELAELVQRRVPVLVDRADELLTTANAAGEEARRGLRQARGVLEDARRWTREGGKIDQVIDEVGGIVGDIRGWTKQGGEIDALLVRANELAGDEGALGKLLIDARTRLDELAQRANRAIDNVNRQLEQGGELHATLANVKQMTGTGEGSTRHQINQLLARVDRMLVDAQRQVLAGDRLQKVIDNLAYAVRRDLRMALSQISESMQTFKQTLIQMQSNPDSIFLGKRRK